MARRDIVLLHETASPGQVFARFTVQLYKNSLIHDSVREAECFVSCVPSIFSLLCMNEMMWVKTHRRRRKKRRSTPLRVCVSVCGADFNTGLEVCKLGLD